MSKAIPAVDALTDKQRFPLMDRYVGVTPNRTQFQYAESRLTAFGMHRRKDASPSVQIFCADAAQPASWSEKLSSAAKGEAASPSPPRDVNESATLGDSDSRETWILALDTLYHFSPPDSQSSTTRTASLMAFDLVLAEDASRLDRVLLMVVSILTGTPFANFVTAAQYRKMLVSAGYAEDGIEVRDVSGHVFAPLARFLKNRERQLGLIGLGIGAYRVARWMFGWWGKSGAVRGVIVIARR
ncbi:hypothetical protein H2199_004913 [Coniosporium tulheliwenetii]|uniref:Uncharacterized protein n=1 Tax=Coniosporium tulheliwenetii TaxID=3383036 RepID=A0ACC2Z473_9PEZI|nr:hypothetical protein H2199_004913 [Cladosporium sp. JES 115]